VNGAEARLVLPTFHGLTASLSATHSRAISTPPFTGGLYLGQDAVDQLSSGPFVIDHDQKLSLHSTLHYAMKNHLWFSGSIRHDSGLVANPSNPAVVAADPDYRDLLPLVNLSSYPARVRPRTVADASVGYERWKHERRNWSVELQIANLSDTSALYNFQSVFVGTRLVAPRAVSVRWRKHW
jgi:hypothetical protein